MSARFCNNCDLAAQDDVEHLVLQCPRWQQAERIRIFSELDDLGGGCGQALRFSPRVT